MIGIFSTVSIFEFTMDNVKNPINIIVKALNKPIYIIKDFNNTSNTHCNL
jgi:hypothetical protein